MYTSFHGDVRVARIMRVGRAAAAGMAGAVAYLVAQEIDRRVANPRSNDLVLLGGLVTSTPALWRPLGLVLHLLAGATFGLIFEAIVAPRLPGPIWLRGIVMAQAENVTLWPLLFLFDRVHPAIPRGDLAPMARPVYFWQSVWRHLALGAVMGACLGPRSAAGAGPLASRAGSAAPRRPAWRAASIAGSTSADVRRLGLSRPGA